MGKESGSVKALCGVFDDSYRPLSRSEFWKLYHDHSDSVSEMISSDDDRVGKLMERSGAMAFSEEKLWEMGIKVVTFLDDEFPHRLLSVLKDFCPPVLYMSGNSGLLSNKFSGYVGSRNIDEGDIRWTENAVAQTVGKGFGVVSGGAKGIDSVSMNCALSHGGIVLAFLPDNLSAKIREREYRENIADDRMLVYSHISPLAPKTRNSFVAAAMERNKYIYAQSNGTAVVRSDLNKGGTWAGAKETLGHNWAPVFAWDNKNYPGNQKLIQMGALPLSDDGRRENNTSGEDEDTYTEAKQITMFDLWKL